VKAHHAEVKDRSLGTSPLSSRDWIVCFTVLVLSNVLRWTSAVVGCPGAGRKMGATSTARLRNSPTSSQCLQPKARIKLQTTPSSQFHSSSHSSRLFILRFDQYSIFCRVLIVGNRKRTVSTHPILRPTWRSPCAPCPPPCTAFQASSRCGTTLFQ
jgi:hypothetical protein